MSQAVIIVILAAVTACGGYLSCKRLTKGGGCCGEHEAAEKTVTVQDRDRSHYPYSAEMKIDGMTCRNCARRVENSLNSEEGIWARVDLNSSTARILSKNEIDKRRLKSIIAAAGYTLRDK